MMYGLVRLTWMSSGKGAGTLGYEMVRGGGFSVEAR
jgi:hypothetical protein